MTNANKTITDVELRRVVKRFGVRKTRQWFLDGPGLPQTLISKAEWVKMRGGVAGWLPYVHEVKAERTVAKLPSLPGWLLPSRIWEEARNG